MAITQDRVMTIIAAGLDYQQGLRRAISLIQQADLANAEKALATLQFQIQESDMLKKPMKSVATLAIEEQHFRKNHAANERRRHKQATKRRDSGVSERLTAPASLMSLDEISGQRHEERIEQRFAIDPLIAELRAQFPDMPTDQFAKIVKEANSQVNNQTGSQGGSPGQYSAFDPPEDDEPAGPIVQAEPEGE